MAIHKPIGLILSFFLLFLIKINGAQVLCPTNERQALLSFKKGVVTDKANRLSSWVGANCCQWKGVVCNNSTGHVVKLDLRNPFPTNSDQAIKVREVTSSLLELKYLNYLDLSYNKFTDITIPTFFGSFKALEYLNLSYSEFSGLIPHSLGNLSALHTLDLNSPSSGEDDDIPVFQVDDLHWTSNLVSLKFLDLSGIPLSSVDISNSNGTIISSLPSLLELHMSSCYLGLGTPFRAPANLSSILVLDLSNNDDRKFDVDEGYNGPIPDSVRNMKTLKSLDLSRNKFLSNGGVFGDLNNLHSLETLDLTGNSFQGDPFGKFTSLSFKNTIHTIRLTENKINVSISPLFGSLTNLKELHLGINRFTGNVPTSFVSLKALEVLELNANDLSGSLPSFLNALSSLRTLDFYANGFTGGIPASYGALSNLEFLDLSYNQLNGGIPLSLQKLSKLKNLLVHDNKLTGKIPVSIGELSNLVALDISNNKLGGRIPMSITKLSNLRDYNVSYNALSGPIPSSKKIPITNDPSVYIGNSKLCGPPLPNKC
ncbi:lysine--tRNA ligase [Ranunculus cassubicifolius]